MQVEQININLIKPYPNNPRNNEAAIKEIAASIKEFGFQQPLVVDAQNVIVVGHTRFEAAKSLGYTEVPCVVAHNLTDAKIRAYRILDNKLNEISTWNEELLAIELGELEGVSEDFDIKSFEVDWQLSSMQPEINTEESKVPEVPKVAQTKLGDVWTCGKHTVVCGDSLDAKNYTEVDMVFTSPPYNLGDNFKCSGSSKASKGEQAYSENINDSKYIGDYLDFLNKFTEHSLNYSELLVCNIQMLAGNKQVFPQYLNNFREKLIDAMIWDKQLAQPAMPRNVLNSQFEFILFFGGNGSRSMPLSDFRGTFSNLYSAPPQRNNEFSNIHGATFPMHLPMHVLGICKKAKTVLDPFLGSGTTLIACERLNRICYGIELEPKYVDVVCQRFYDETKIIPVNQDGLEFVPNE